jgi:hypothetical protein
MIATPSTPFSRRPHQAPAPLWPAPTMKTLCTGAPDGWVRGLTQGRW